MKTVLTTIILYFALVAQAQACITYMGQRGFCRPDDAPTDSVQSTDVPEGCHVWCQEDRAPAVGTLPVDRGYMWLD